MGGGGGQVGGGEGALGTWVMSTTSEASSMASKPFFRSPRRRVQARGPGSKNVAAPLCLAATTADITTEIGNSSKMNPFTKRASVLSSICNHIS